MLSALSSRAGQQFGQAAESALPTPRNTFNVDRRIITENRTDVSRAMRSFHVGRRVLSTALLITAFSAVTAAGDQSVPRASAQPTTCGAFFDDFHYDSVTDAAFTSNGWQARSGTGGPGPAEATWSPENVTFTPVAGDAVVQLAATTGGTPQGTTNSQITQADRRFLAGTYAARVRFSDAPVTGPDGDDVVQTFFTISPLAHENDPTYSELDFAEYVPNGAWGQSEAANHQTSWYTVNSSSPSNQNKSTAQVMSLDGWHEIGATVADDRIRYYIDGTLTAEHDRTGLDVYPRQPMSLDFSQWFTTTLPHAGTTSTYHQQVDWVYYSNHEVVTPENVRARVAAMRSEDIAFKDDLVTTCSPPTSTTTSPAPTTATSSAPAPPTTSNVPTTPAVAAPAPPRGGGELAATGTDVRWALWPGFALLTTGLFVVLATRRRRFR